jgi:RHS repeat-associated protein
LTTRVAYQGVGQDQLTQDSSTTLVNDLLGSAGSVTEGTTTAYFTRTPSGQLISMRINGQSYYYDQRLPGLGGGPHRRRRLRGDRLQLRPYGYLTAALDSVGQPFGYAGGYFDNSSGLYHFGARYYDPSLGRWTQLDPSGASSGYVYAGDNPVNLTDPGGLGFIDFFTHTVPHFSTHAVPNVFNKFAIQHGARASFQSGITQYLGV